MVPLSLRCPPAMTLLPSSPRRPKPAMESSGRSITFPSNSHSSSKSFPGGWYHHPSFISRPLAPGTLQVATGSNPKTTEATGQETQSKDNDLVFVAGATGKVGSRTVRELLTLGFRVRAGVRSTQRAETLVQSVRQMKLDDAVGSSGTQPVDRLEIVECDVENRSGIRPAIRRASIVICCIGASEKEVFDITGPYRIDFQATKNLIEAATLSKIDHFILLTSLGTNKIGFPAAILNLFWGVLIWKRRAEEALISSGLPYTIVRPGGMERPTDSYKETHNIVLASEDTYFGGQVSNLQVAELMAFMAKDRRVSLYKVVEVIAETTASLTPMEVLLAKISPQREIETESKPDPVPPITKSEPTKPIAEEEPSQIEVPEERPLSPYAMYDDLKPPTSPTPIPSSVRASSKEKQVELQAISVPKTTSETSSSVSPEVVTEKEKIQVTVQKTWILSPYAAYEDLKQSTSPNSSTRQKKVVNVSDVYDDLKPPTSPTPTPSTSPTTPKEKQVELQAISISETSSPVSTEVITEEEKIQVIVQKTRPLSPYTAYEDLKPPVSPTPTPSTGAEKELLTAVLSEFNAGEHTLEITPTLPDILSQSSGYRSPYHAYEDLKPPTSPVPSVPQY